MAEHCTTHKIPLTRLTEAASSPALAALFAEGWEVVATVMIDNGNGDPMLEMLMRPPRKVAPLIAPSRIIATIFASAVSGALASVGLLQLLQ